ncbi:hypothetical protein GCM10010140_38030 [Streptosporangium pseudovulgare]|uniref:GNAT family N-acetyltransferase n=1 Tax=Streptosporangium pseudovulgare TaxID=35765 RepID=A0ABQ2QYF4_9ACTN|nr:hypothetical protein GCM10010140_38030 [Streptosporangium pseudovulgare]
MVHPACGHRTLSPTRASSPGSLHPGPSPSETPERLRARLARSFTRLGFTAWTVHDDDRLTGVCYGWPTPADLPDDHLYEAIIGALGPDTARRLGHATGTTTRHVTRRTSSRAAGRSLSPDVPDRQDPW